MGPRCDFGHSHSITLRACGSYRCWWQGQRSLASRVRQACAMRRRPCQSYSSSNSSSISEGMFFLNLPFSMLIRLPLLIDLLMGLFRGAVFRHDGGALKQPIKQPTETPTSTLSLMGRFRSLMGRFPTLMGRFTDFVLRGRFAS